MKRLTNEQRHELIDAEDQIQTDLNTEVTQVRAEAAGKIISLKQVARDQITEAKNTIRNNTEVNETETQED